MSRIAKTPVEVPENVEVSLENGELFVKGQKGALTLSLHNQVQVSKEEKVITFQASNGSRLSRAMAGTTRALVSNMVTGVSSGFKKHLKLVGVGYRAQAKGKVLNLNLGYSHPVEYTLPEGIEVQTPKPTEIVLEGIDKQLVGQVAAEIRNFRRPEPYKGKGIRYADENVRTKEAKKK